MSYHLLSQWIKSVKEGLIKLIEATCQTKQIEIQSEISDQIKPCDKNKSLLNNDLCDDLYGYMDQYLCFKDKLNFRRVSKRFRDLEIIDLFNVNNEIKRRLTEDILRQRKYQNLKMLRISGPRMNLNFLKKIKKLDISMSGFNHCDFEELELEFLNVSHCPNITDLSKMTSLKELIIRSHGNYGRHSKSRLYNLGIMGLTNVEILDVSGNKNIISVNHMKSLKKLYARGDSGICDKGIHELSELEVLDIRDNEKVSDLKNLNLKQLDVSSNNRYDIDIKHMTNLVQLRACGNCGINNDSIKGMNLKTLDASNNVKISDIISITQLKVLIACGNSEINDNSIKDLNLERLDVSGNQRISSIQHMTKLKVLIARDNSGINDQSLYLAILNGVVLEDLDITGNLNVIESGHMIKLKRLKTENAVLLT